MSLDVYVGHSEGTLTVALVGEIDVSTAGLLDEKVGAALHAFDDMSALTIVVDASNLSFLDSSGVAALIRLSQKTAETGGSLTVTSPSRIVRRVLGAVGLLDHFGIDQEKPAASEG